MKIGIAINGEGRGHFSRARALAEILEERYEIAFWTPDHLAGELSTLFPKAEIHNIPHFSFVQTGFSLDYPATIAVNGALMLLAPRVCARIAREMEKTGIATLLSDFEPFSSRAAKSLGIPVLQLNHPSVVTRSFSFPCGIRSFFHQIASKIVSRYMTAYADRKIICSFFDGDVGPIIRKELREKRTERGDYFVVYMKPMYRAWLEPVLDRLGRDKFRVFPDAKEDYATTLARSRALIAPAGHQSISEALALGKPVFAIPVSGQYEQLLNAQKLRESGFGDYADFANIATALPAFIGAIHDFETAIARTRLAGTRAFRAAWTCEDQTFRAACMVENFIIESRIRPEWRRRNPALALLPGLF